MKHKFTLVQTALLLAGFAAVPAFAAPFVSGSTGADGAFAPSANITVQLPPSGVLHYTTVNIPAGVTVKFAKNSANTAVVILTTGEVKIAGSIDVSGGASLTTKYGLAADMNKGGVGGPGGFDGGRGGLQEQNRLGGTGLGPGGGGGGTQNSTTCGNYVQGGGGGGFAGYGAPSQCIANNGAYVANVRTGYGGAAYGSNTMLPLVGGSGGGGGNGGPNAWGLPGSGGGGGGGALMLVASGPVELTGTIKATGAVAGNINNGDCRDGGWGGQFNDSGGAGGGGAGGAVRLLTPAFSGGGSINVSGGAGGCLSGGSSLNGYNAGGSGGVGRSSVEIVSGGTFSLSVIPTLAITSIGGVAVPPNPSGAGDVTLAGELPNPAGITISASGIPVGTVVKLTLSQPYADKVTANASALAGTLQASTSTGSINIPSGSSVLMASTTYALSVAQGEALKIYAEGERVEKVNLAAVMGGEMRVTLITVSGKEFEVPAAVLAAAQIELG
ncbi:hypothetical protein [Sulfuritalea sp.]|uniref:hypothetical protein n=1 Tax=Sulfuritalea sp. TaxID=2480090 RepID=UPI00286D7A4B|nr:hypothetical protein [Sulfuritalea sp.]